MKDIAEDHLYLDYFNHKEDCIFPLHTYISLFLLSYCDCKTFKVFLVTPDENASDVQLTDKVLPKDLEICLIKRCELPLVAQICCLPAIVEKNRTFCHAGLAVVLRHIIHKTYESDPSKENVLELLGFKKTCLKACAEVSEWTRLCEISIPLAVENCLKGSPDQHQNIPEEVLQFEKKLGEPVKVHNDDKIRRQKVEQQTTFVKTASNDASSQAEKLSETVESIPADLELSVAFSKLTVQKLPVATCRKPSHIRKMKTSELPLLEHVFAEGLYFTLADVVLFPCIHHFLAFSKKYQENRSQLPLIFHWYQRVQEVPGIKQAAVKCNLQFSKYAGSCSLPDECQQNISTVSDETEEKHDVAQFIGGPRPTLSKLMENGIEAKFSPHPCPSWVLDWDSLPEAVNPGKGKMSSDRALRKQQQLNNLVALVTNLAKPEDVIVDFCSGGGHVGIVLAHILSSCKIVLVENKELSLIRAKERSCELGLKNIWFIQANMDNFKGMFNIGVALHACGVATDMVIESCIKVRAAFVISPCCYGFIQNTAKFAFPRSHQFKEVLSCKEHMVLCRFADQTAVQLPPERRKIGKHCMGLVDLDRAWNVERWNYSVQVITMEPETCSPKNNMIVGVPV
ncbi:glutathione S-transferase C-terminal domain-containing protein isoform X1 [Varanus komodoensis]|uniref:glutathione S-transferase C-terminal domain-containing protein isoform X1 n=1 Tax=Varanus komodoensis TaxID=61221 RepID=UPI001CF7CCDB|nr:glutathione S-transferase C-terminal domain-containing protein isoform X1 [Varanus komodoensis]XP_044284305.1 glutathione S-transferase C-terminal domain-containing protein isoform X1 [Varanus komodoensis]XP_044284306.1 glutathione S-transferase C-terminal domain-containing protein isoform X1 [Varanus komodoensis]